MEIPKNFRPQREKTQEEIFLPALEKMEEEGFCWSGWECEFVCQNLGVPFPITIDLRKKSDLIPQINIGKAKVQFPKQIEIEPTKILNAIKNSHLRIWQVDYIEALRGGLNLVVKMRVFATEGFNINKFWEINVGE